MAYQDQDNAQPTATEHPSPKSPAASPRILGLCGSVRAGSYSLKALDVALSAAQQAGADCQAWSQQQMQLPLCDGTSHNEAVLALREAVQQSDALILATPEYCGSLSAVMKNAIEWIGYDLLVQKPVGLIAVAAGSSADGSLNAMRQLALVQGMWVLPATAPVPLAERVFGSFEHSEQNIEAVEDEFSQIVLQHLQALGQALPEAVRRLNTPSAQSQAVSA